MSETKILTKEDFYKEDFKCFRHYVILKDCNTKNRIIPVPVRIEESKYEDRIHFRVTGDRNYNKDKKNEYKNVIIFDEIPKLDLTNFYKTTDFGYPYGYNDCFYYKHEMISGTKLSYKDTRNKCNFHLSKFNHNWEVKDISNEKKLKLKDGTTIPYRTATVIIEHKDEKKLEIKDGKIVRSKQQKTC